MSSCKIFDDNIKQFLPSRRPREKIPLINSTNDIPSNKRTSLLKCAIKNKLQKQPNSKSFDSEEINILPSKYSQKQLEFHMNNRLSNLPRTVSSEDESISGLEKITDDIPTSNILGMMKFKRQYLSSRKSSDSEITNVVNDASKLPFIAKKDKYKIFRTKNKRNSSNFLSNDYFNITSTEGEMLEVLKSANDFKREKLNFRCHNKYLKKSKSEHSTQQINQNSKSFRLIKSTGGHQNELKMIAPNSSSNCSSISQKGLKSEIQNDFINVPTIDMVSRKKQDKCIPCLLKSARHTSPTTPVKKSSPSTILSDDSDDSTILPFLQTYKQEQPFENTKPLDQSLEDIRIDSKKSKNKTNNHYEMFRKDETVSTSQNEKATVSNQQSFDFVTGVNKPSSDSSHHSEIDEDDGDDNFFELKILAPCHEPIVLEPSMEPLYALMNKKFTSMEDRIKSQMVQQSQDFDSSDEDNPKDSRPSSPAVQEKEAGKSPDSVDKKKKLERTQTLASFLPGKIDDNKKKLKRSKTVLELQKTEEDEEHKENEEICNLSEEKSFTKEELILQDVERAVDEGRVVTLNDILRLITSGFGNDGSDMSQLHHVVHRYLQYINRRDQGFGLANRAFNLLIESKSCLANCSKRFAINKDNLKKIIPENTYNEIASILNLPKWSSDEDEKNLDDESLDRFVEISRTDAIDNKNSNVRNKRMRP